jgi:hypothetical protein
MAIVEFTKDCYPYCKGDRIELSEEERKDVDALAVAHPVKISYLAARPASGAPGPMTGRLSGRLDVSRPAVTRTAVDHRYLDLRPLGYSISF